MPFWIQQDLRISVWVLLPIACGILLRRSGVPKSAARGFFGFAFYGCQTSVTVCALWIARVHAEARSLPALALAGWLGTAALAWAVTRKTATDSKRRGAFILSMAMSNNGFTLLGFVSLALFGEAGLAQATYAQLLYTPFFLLCCFPIARLFGSARKPQSLGALLLDNAKDPRVWLPLLAVFVGLGLNLAQVPRPALVTPLTRLFIYAGTASSGAAIGLLFSGFHFRRYARENALSFLHRSTLYPLFYWAAARLCGLHPLDATILVLYGLVPSALLANLLAVFFDLDTDLTSSVFLVSTVLFLVLVLPVFLVLARP